MPQDSPRRLPPPGVYLQVTRGLLALPASHVASTPAIEYSLIDPTDGTLVGVQVKTGGSQLDLGALAEYVEDVGGRAIAYAASGRYVGDGRGLVETIDTAELLAFIAQHPLALPPRVRRWLERLPPSC